MYFSICSYSRSPMSPEQLIVIHWLPIPESLCPVVAVFVLPYLNRRILKKVATPSALFVIIGKSTEDSKTLGTSENRWCEKCLSRCKEVNVTSSAIRRVIGSKGTAVGRRRRKKTVFGPLPNVSDGDENSSIREAFNQSNQL